MDRTLDRRPESISIRASRKLFLPILWLLLVSFFFRDKFRRHNVKVDDAPPLLPEDEEQKNASAIAVGEATQMLKPYGTVPNATYSAANISTSNKVAVIVDTRASGNIVPLVLHFSAVLGPTWPVLIYTPSENFGTFTTSAALLRYQAIGRVVVRPLAEGVWFPNWDSVSGFLTTSWLWEELAPAEHILLFQSDSILCSNSVRSVEDFFEYDYIGAPIHPVWGAGFNGGLSLRKRSTILKVLTDWTYQPGQGPEDQWYYSRMRDLQTIQAQEGIEEGLVNLPSMEIARTFAVETIDYPNPLGLHQPMRFIGAQDHMIPLDDWCPEYKLVTTGSIAAGG